MTAALPKTDAAWRAELPASLNAAAELHFSSLDVIEAASDWLVKTAGQDRQRFVDLGAGVGKFCLTAAARHPTHDWLGVELRPQLLAEANRLQTEAGLSNCSFQLGDLTVIDLRDYSGAYVFNPLAEALDPRPDLGRDIPHGPAAYRAMRTALQAQLRDVRSGFRLATYFLAESEVPAEYSKVWSREEGRLEGWVAV